MFFVQYLVRENFKGASYNACFAVFDGHGGPRAAEFARLRLGAMLESNQELETNVVASVKTGKCHKPARPEGDLASEKGHRATCVRIENGKEETPVRFPQSYFARLTPKVSGFP